MQSGLLAKPMTRDKHSNNNRLLKQLCDFSERGGVEDQAEYLCQENYGYNFFT
jgi:hypothetical protein